MTDEEFDLAVAAIDAEDEAMGTIHEFKRPVKPVKAVPVCSWDEWVWGRCAHCGIDAFQ